MLYSIGKDSLGACCIWRSRRSIRPSRPFPLLHVDTTWKFREMIAFRDRRARELGLDLIVHTNQDGVARGHQPDHARLEAAHRRDEDAGAAAGARRPRLRRRLRRRAPRRGESRAKERVFSFRNAQHRWDPKQPAAGAVAPLQRTHSARARASASSRSPTGPSSTSGNTSTRSGFRSCRCICRAQRPVVERDGTLIMVDDERMPLAPGEQPQMRTRALPHARLLSADRARSKRRRRRCPKIIRETLGEPAFRAAAAASSITTAQPRWSARSRKVISDDDAHGRIPSEFAIDDFLHRQERKQACCVYIACGSVDHGKSRP